MTQAEYLRERQTISPEEASAMILALVKESAQGYLEQMVTDAVISVLILQRCTTTSNES